MLTTGICFVYADVTRTRDLAIGCQSTLPIGVLSDVLSILIANVPWLEEEWRLLVDRRSLGCFRLSKGFRGMAGSRKAFYDFPQTDTKGSYVIEYKPFLFKKDHATFSHFLIHFVK